MTKAEMILKVRCSTVY